MKQIWERKMSKLKLLEVTKLYRKILDFGFKNNTQEAQKRTIPEWLSLLLV